jgi:hypothetical protein
MISAQKFTVDHYGRINRAEYPKSSCSYQSSIRVEHIVSKPRNNSSVNITNKMHVLHCEVTFNKFNADTG